MCLSFPVLTPGLCTSDPAPWLCRRVIPRVHRPAPRPPSCDELGKGCDRAGVDTVWLVFGLPPLHCASQSSASPLPATLSVPAQVLGPAPPPRKQPVRSWQHLLAWGRGVRTRAGGTEAALSPSPWLGALLSEPRAHPQAARILGERMYMTV